MNKTYIVKMPDKKIGIDYFLDSKKGIVVDISECLKNKKLMLSEVQSLCDNVITLNKNNKDYYIGNIKYLSIEETEKYIYEAFEELGQNIIKSKTYLCIEHVGKYKKRYKSYKKLLTEIQNKNYKICGIPVEQYINGSWNRTSENKYLTNIMIPIMVNY